MEEKKFYHLYANGKDAKNFIISQDDYYAAFNLLAVCAYNCGVAVAGQSVEESHPHSLLYGTWSACTNCMIMYEDSYKKHISTTRGGLDEVVLIFTLSAVEDMDRLKTLGVYVIAQATKDGKRIMPYDYKWGTGSIYFRQGGAPSIWCFDENGNYHKPVPLSSLNRRERMKILHSKKPYNPSWLTVNGFILPQSYVDIKLFESIYVTHNCFRAFLASGKNKDEAIIQKMAADTGISLEDREARKITKELCSTLFHTVDIRRLGAEQRFKLALELRRSYRISKRQIATMVRLPLFEIEKYFR